MPSLQQSPPCLAKVQRRTYNSPASVISLTGYNRGLPVSLKIGRKLTAIGLVPRSHLARVTAWLAAVELALFLLSWFLHRVGATAAGSFLSGWIRFLGYVLAVAFFVVAVRWFRKHVMWRLRNQLMVTYLFIGVLPITLVLVLTMIAGRYSFSQFATFLTASEIQSQLQRLAAANSAAAEQIIKHSAKPEEICARDTEFPGRKILISRISERPDWLKDGFSGLVTDHGQFYLRAVDSTETKSGRVSVISSVPLGKQLLGQIASRFGRITFSYTDILSPTQSAPSADNAAPASRPPAIVGEAITAGTVPAARSFLDRQFEFEGLVPLVEWSSGKKEGRALLAGTTRPSLIYSHLSEYLGDWTDKIAVYLVVFAIMFFVIVVLALFIGLRLTRIITSSVANLYEATQRINRGDFTHRIEVRQSDQLAALQVAFNSMTESLEKLIAEQKEKERMQSELEIAHEVQEQLFPRAISNTKTLELYGLCRPARTVSGDYYDFLPSGPDQLGIAVGDISGKGISAALLMASIHSAVRAFEREPWTTTRSDGNGQTAALATRNGHPSPAQMLRALNHHLYQSTQAEKYATLFLGFYDGEHHRMTCSNAGHLPPIILGRDGSIRRLDVGGMVVGLFDNLDYKEQTVDFNPGDIFVAFSDGITEPENEFGEFGEERLLEAVAAYRHLPLTRITEHVIAAVQDWIGSTEPPDDITLVLARRLA
jgi:sigma-B regulation protein RsbU (phosphoserine phosphatase)